MDYRSSFIKLMAKVYLREMRMSLLLLWKWQLCQQRGRARDQHGLGLKPIRAILLCPRERHFTAHSPAWWSWQAVLNYSHISIKLQADSYILASPEAGRGNCLLYVFAPPSLSCESGG